MAIFRPLGHLINELNNSLVSGSVEYSNVPIIPLVNKTL